MSRRSATLVVAALLLVALASVATLLPVPYVRLSPGPATDTLGAVSGKPLIRIVGRDVYPSKGAFELTTVAVSAAEHKMGLIEALRGWVDPRAAVVPRETIYPDDKSTDEIQHENAEQMELSQQHATAAALRSLDIPVETTVIVSSVSKSSPALGKLHAGDVILEVDSRRVSAPDQVRDAIRKHSPGENVTLTVSTKKKQRTVTVKSTAAPDDKTRALVGFVPETGYEFPFTVDIEIENVGGPSAGLMFALGIVDKLTRDDLTGGKTVAGTGTIDDAGVVGPIGGIEMKVLGAKASGADVFLVPADNCASAKRNAPDGLRLVKVARLGDALKALDALRTGKGAVAAC
jgi:PDZ domain-containing protein